MLAHEEDATRIFRARTKFYTESRTEQAVTPSPKVLTSSLYDWTRPDKKVFREPPESVFALAVYPDYLFFPGGCTAPTDAGGKGGERFGDAPSSNRYVFRVALLVPGITSWPGFAKEHSANFDNHSKFLRLSSCPLALFPSSLPHPDRIPNFQA